MMKIGFDIATALFALLAAVFWFLSAKNELPPMLSYWDATPMNDPFFVALRKGVRLNRIAALLAGVSALCAAASAIVSNTV